MRKLTTHHILAHSYSVYLGSLALGLFLDVFYPIKIIPQYLNSLGMVLLFAAPLLILWAQSTSSFLMRKKEALTTEDFKRGPYGFTRSPTHLGLTLMVIGYGIIVNSISIAVLSAVAYFISKKIFLKEEEEMLAASYGQEYVDYKKEVDSWM
jgi:protein-S-isoprenylcysteine O-methyltransferase Ste14